MSLGTIVSFQFRKLRNRVVEALIADGFHRKRLSNGMSFSECWPTTIFNCLKRGGKTGVRCLDIPLT